MPTTTGINSSPNRAISWPASIRAAISAAAFEHSTHKELGKLETEDFIDFGEYPHNPMSTQNASAFKGGRTGDS